MKRFITILTIGSLLFLSYSMVQADSIVEDVPRDGVEVTGGTTTSHQDIQGAE